jgi:hypothetical protein
MAKDDTAEDLLPDKDAAKEFYAKYEPKEVLGRLVIRYLTILLRIFLTERYGCFVGVSVPQCDGVLRRRLEMSMPLRSLT